MSACPECSSELLPGARFCRACGRPVQTSDPATDAATVALESSATPKQATVTSAAYLPPNLAGLPTTPLEAPPVIISPPRRSRKLSIFLSIVLAMFVGLGAAGFVGYRILREKFRDFTSDVTVASGPEAEAEAAPLKDLRYPNSKIVSAILKGNEGGRLVTMETTDSITRVSEYYQAHIKSPNPTVISDDSVLLGFPDGLVTITKSDGKTSIFVAVKAGQGIGIPSPLPPAPPPPLPPLPGTRPSVP